MERLNRDISKEFVDQIQKYLKHFGLIDADLGGLIGTNSGDIKHILDFTKSIGIKRLDRISSVFGLTYYQFGNPDFPFPNFESLPLKTKQAILNRKELGISFRNYDNDIAGNLDRIIHETALFHHPVTAEEIRFSFPLDIRDTIKSTRITDLLKKSGRDRFVVQVGKRGREHLFQLKEFAEK